MAVCSCLYTSSIYYAVWLRRPASVACPSLFLSLSPSLALVLSTSIFHIPNLTFILLSIWFCRLMHTSTCMTCTTRVVQMRLSSVRRTGACLMSGHESYATGAWKRKKKMPCIYIYTHPYIHTHTHTPYTYVYTYIYIHCQHCSA